MDSKGNRGGKRPNSGRKILDPEEKKQTKILFRRVPVELYDEIEKLVDSFIKFANQKIKKD